MGSSPSKHGKTDHRSSGGGSGGGGGGGGDGVVVVSSPSSPLSPPSSSSASSVSSSSLSSITSPSRESIDHHDFPRPLLSQRTAGTAALSASNVLALVSPLLESQGARVVAIGATQSALVLRAAQAQQRAAALLPTASANVDDTRRYARRVAVLVETVDEILRRTNDDIASVRLSHADCVAQHFFSFGIDLFLFIACFHYKTICKVAR
jgi:hypothetical protein